MKLTEHLIDDLLKEVDSALIASYERFVMATDEVVKKSTQPFFTLQSVNETVKELKAGMTRRVKKVKRFVIAILLIAFSCGGALMMYNKDLFVCVPAITVITFLIYMIPKHTRLDRDFEELEFAERILEEFRESVRLLNPTGRTMRSYNEMSVREEALCLAFQILDAEMRLDIVRRQDRLDLSSITHLAQYILKQRDKLEGLLEIAEDRFGLSFNKRGIFAEAEKQLKK